MICTRCGQVGDEPVPKDAAPGRTCFALDPQVVARMFGEGLRLVDVRYDREREQVEIVLEGRGQGQGWRQGCNAWRVKASPLPTAYVMADER